MIPASLNSVLPGVVEEAAVPLFVVPPGGGMEETRSGAIKAVQAILSVLGGVAVDDIQQHHDAQWMSHVDQLLQLVRSPVAATNMTHTDVCESTTTCLKNQNIYFLMCVDEITINWSNVWLF